MTKELLNCTRLPSPYYFFLFRYFSFFSVKVIVEVINDKDPYVYSMNHKSHESLLYICFYIHMFYP